MQQYTAIRRTLMVQLVLCVVALLNLGMALGGLWPPAITIPLGLALLGLTVRNCLVARQRLRVLRRL